MHPSSFKSIFSVFLLLFLFSFSVFSADIIVDNTDAGFNTLNGNWWTVASGDGFIGDNFQTTGNDPANKARYTPNLPSDGSYEIFVRFTTSWHNLGDGAPYTVFHSGSSTTVRVNQTINGGTWVSIGTYNLSIGDYVELGADLYDGKRPCADAVRFVGPAGPTYNLEVSPSSLNYSTNSGTQTLTVTSNTTWTAFENLSWLTLNTSGGTNNGSVSVTCQSNSSPVARTGEIIFNADNVEPVTITVTQAAAPCSLQVYPAGLLFSNTGGSQSGSIESNYSWNISESVSWLSVSPLNGTGAGTYTVTCDTNTNTVSRSGEITFNSDCGLSQTISVSQDPAGAAPTIVSFTTTDNYLCTGDTAILSWEVRGGPTEIRLSRSCPQGWDYVDSLGTDTITICSVDDEYVIYDLEASNANGTVQATISIFNDNNCTTAKQNSQKIAITGELYDDQGNPVGASSPEDVDASISLYTASTGGTAVYTETFYATDSQAVTVDYGLFTARLGEGSTTDDLPSVIRANGNLWTEVTIERNGAMETLMPRTPLTASPYSLNNAAIVIEGTGNPNTVGIAGPIGAYYVDQGDGNRTYLKLHNSWIALD